MGEKVTFFPQSLKIDGGDNGPVITFLKCLDMRLYTNAWYFFLPNY